MDYRNAKCAQCGAECKVPVSLAPGEVRCARCQPASGMHAAKAEHADEGELPTKITPRKDLGGGGSSSLN